MIDIRPITREQALPFLHRAARFDAGGTLDDVPGALYLGAFDPELVGAYMLHMVGDTLHIRAGAGLQVGVDWSAVGFAAIVAQARHAGIERVSFCTRRRALIRKSAPHGFRVSGYILTAEV